MVIVAIFGAGKIGSAVYKILSTTKEYPYTDVSAFVIDADFGSLFRLGNHHALIDVASQTADDLAFMLKKSNVTHVINAMPFFYNEKIATAAAIIRCDYIDFTEDDIMAEKVKKIYSGTGLTCATKCGLAPGFINYVGYDLVGKIDMPDSLMVSVGALPRTVSYSEHCPAKAYNLSWSVDGLVNEYVRPCRVKLDNQIQELKALTGIEKVNIDGSEYEAAYTSGGGGTLIDDLVELKNVYYKTLRYPNHFKFLNQIVDECNNDFGLIRSRFLEIFPETDDDVIVVYATAEGKSRDGRYIRKIYSNKFYGTNGMSGIQSTTAGSGVAILELIIKGKLHGIIGHTDVALQTLTDTVAFKKYFKTSK